MADDLRKPLGLPAAPGSRRRIPGAAVLVGLLAVVVVLAIGGAAYLASRNDESTAVATINGAPTGPGGISPEITGSILKAPARAAPGAAPAAPGAPGLTEMTATGGVSGVDDGEVVIHDPSVPPPVRLAAAPREDLVEKGRYGLLPRIGDDGARAIDVYARPAETIPPGSHRIAIVIGGIGVSSDTTEQAIENLPGAMTLAFAPYGDELGGALLKARSAGHEILLQVPLEPFDYPQNNPGPHTLTADASTAENIDRLHWLMSRMTTYVGVVNYMGARFTGDADRLAPILAEIGGRGLLYLDDGSSARSATATAAGNKVPYLRADVVLDGDADASGIDARLGQLEAIARERGYAIGVATAFPASIDKIAAFAKTAGDHGIVFVPLSSLVQSGRT